MKSFTVGSLAILVLSAAPIHAQTQDPDRLALACHIVLRDLNRYPTEATHSVEGTTVEINFKSGAEGGEPNGILCEFETEDAVLPTLRRLVSDTKRGTESPLYLESGQSAIEQYFTELTSSGSVMAPVEVSPLANSAVEGTAEASAEIPAQTAEGENPVVEDFASPEGEDDVISEEADKLFWCSHAFAQIATMSHEAGGENARPIVDQFNGFATALEERGVQMLEDEGFDTSDLTELHASYSADIYAQFVAGTEEPLFTQEQCEALVGPFTPAQALP